MRNPWNKIFEHDFKSAHKIADENYLQSNEIFDLRSRAVSSFLLRDYDVALIDFLLINNINKAVNRSSDVCYMDIGLCYYALGDFENAKNYFKYPVLNKKEIKYTSDISVYPSVLLFIGIKLAMPDMIKLAIKELQRLSKFKTVAPNYLLGNISEKEIDNEVKIQANETLRNRKQCKVEFYKATRCLQLGFYDEYKHHIKCCYELTGKYLEFEYYIAMVECEVYLR